MGDMTGFENITDLTTFFTTANALTDGLLGVSLGVSVFVVLFLTTYQFGRSKALMYTSFITGILLALLNAGGLVDSWLIIADLIIFSISVIMILSSRRSDS